VDAKEICRKMKNPRGREQYVMSKVSRIITRDMGIAEEPKQFRASRRCRKSIIEAYIREGERRRDGEQ
jgi:hypothetical protein